MAKLELEKVKADDCLIIDNDFERAAQWLCSRMFGSSYKDTLAELKRRYAGDDENEPDLDSLVYLMACHRVAHRNLLLKALTPDEEEMQKLLVLAGRAIDHKHTEGIDTETLEHIRYRAQLILPTEI